MLETLNENRKEKDYHVGQVVYEKKHGERNKLKSRYKKQVEENMPNKIIMTTRASPTPTSLTSYTTYIIVELRQVQKRTL